MKTIAAVLTGIALCGVAGFAAAEDMNDPGIKACERLSGQTRERCISQVRQDDRAADNRGGMNGMRTPPRQGSGSYGGTGSGNGSGSYGGTGSGGTNR